MGMEIERKYLIRMPDAEKLRMMPGCVEWEITQTYLTDGAAGETRRVRRIDVHENGEIRTIYVYTYKRHISSLSQIENENELTREEYDELLKDKNNELTPVCKRRLRIPYEGRLAEIDIYDFWTDRATLEIELESEEQKLAPPDWLDVVREVTGEKAYKNRQLAAGIPYEEI